MLVIIFCVMMSSLFNGLCLGLIALDVTDLRVIASCGTEHERGNARKILPVRQKGNELLCSILLTSTLANAVFTVLVDDHVEGWVAAIVSTLIIVIFVEIIPCSVVSRYGMIIGAKTIWLTKGVMILTFPLSFTLGRILNRILGKEISMYTKDRIKELVKITSSYTKMEKQEVDIISGALELSTKSAKEVMTPIEDTFMLPLDGRLDFETISNIVRSGYSRIPIYDGSRSNIVSLLFTKDLAILDPDDRTEIKTIVNFYNHECLFVQEDTMLNNMFVVFKEGKMGHLGIVYSTEYIMNNQRYYDATGIVTLEDVLEEVIKSEIVDETDDVLDNRSKKKSSMVRRRQMTHCLDLFLQDNEKSNVCISPQLRMAALQFLSSGMYRVFLKIERL
ncbi:hypothetical protein AAG570_004577 [Ranatra chinensis]|uniref:CNNM transmembrane domain-containing protein n=1 Tax=Ranatra chinensis TaxID=642074 RepID=A0ABD0Y1A3_9HEMI